MTPKSLPGLTEPILLLVLICSDDHPRLLYSATLAAAAPPAEAKQLHTLMVRAVIVPSPEWPAVPQRPTKSLVNGAGFLQVGVVILIPQLEPPEPLHTSLPPSLTWIASSDTVSTGTVETWMYSALTPEDWGLTALQSKAGGKPEIIGPPDGFKNK